jgi:phosphoglycolate phosphatase
MNALMSRKPIDAVLFDLDGTVLDTAPDLVASANWALMSEGLPPCPLEEAKPYISGGARTMLGYWIVKTVERRPVFNFPQVNQVSPKNDDLFSRLIDRMLEHYEANVANQTAYFCGMEAVLDELDARRLPWGIVTNKQSRLTEPLAAALQLSQRTDCIISGDTTPKAKPHPLPLLEASQRLGIQPEHCVYIGDSARDIEAGRRAGMKTLAALYGYIAADEDVDAWGADDALECPSDLIPWIEAAR